jgi:hypothetical protein
MKIKTAMRNHLMPIRISIITIHSITSAGEDVEKRESLHIVGENVN